MDDFVPAPERVQGRFRLGGAAAQIVVVLHLGGFDPGLLGAQEALADSEQIADYRADRRHSHRMPDDRPE